MKKKEMMPITNEEKKIKLQARSMLYMHISMFYTDNDNKK